MLGRLQISMDDAALVRRIQRLGNLSSDGQRLFKWYCTTRDLIGQCWTFDQFHHQRTRR